MPELQSEQYFNSRPRSSRIGAWSSNQSKIIRNRDELDKQEQVIIKQFENQDQIPKPAHWGGYRLVPTKIEFWKGRESRMHDRIVYELDSDNKWIVKRLQP